MGDIRKAGTDRGDLRAELKNYLTAIRIRREEYMSIIDDLEPDELEYDLMEYREFFEREVKPLCDKAMHIGVGYLVDLARQITETYEEIFREIEKRLEKA